MFPRLQRGDKVGIVSPSFGAAGQWPDVYELGLRRIREDFGLEPVEFAVTRKRGASSEERAADLITAFEAPEIKAVFTTLGGNDQVTYVKNLPSEPFRRNPKPFFGYSDNTHFTNFLWQHGIPSYYGTSVLGQFAFQGHMDFFTTDYLNFALFQGGERELHACPKRVEMELDWNDSANLARSREYEPNEGWYWEGSASAEGLSWGGCVESIDEILRHGIEIPLLEQFENVVLLLETSEEMPDAGYVFRVVRALGERGILQRVRGILIGRPQAWHFGREWPPETRQTYRERQRAIVIETVRKYNATVSIVQNLDFGHTNPQIAMPYRRLIRLEALSKRIFVDF